MSLAEIRNHLQDGHDETQAALNFFKSGLDVHINRAHVAVGAAMAAGLSSPEINEIAGRLTEIDSDGTQLVEKTAAVMAKLSEIGSL